MILDGHLNAVPVGYGTGDGIEKTPGHQIYRSLRNALIETVVVDDRRSGDIAERLRQGVVRQITVQDIFRIRSRKALNICPRRLIRRGIVEQQRSGLVESLEIYILDQITVALCGIIRTPLFCRGTITGLSPGLGFRLRAEVRPVVPGP